jgi:hypothetical protein
VAFFEDVLMDNEMIKKWEAMLATLTAAQKSSLICSETEIEQVEKELGFKFPAGYIEVISPSNRPNIPRLAQITITVTGSQLTREVFEGLFTKMVKIGKECGCSSSGFGISSGAET